MAFHLLPGLRVKALCTMFGVFAGIASADPIITMGNGIENIGNFSVVVSGTSSTGCINFYNGNAPDGCNLLGNDTFSVNPPDDPALFTNGATGTIKDLVSPTGPETAFIANTVGGTGSTPVTYDFMSLIPTGSNVCTTSSDTPPFPQACAIAGSAFNVTINSLSDITVSFGVNLCGYTGASGGVGCSNGTLYTGSFDSRFITSFVNGAGVTVPVTLANLVEAESTVGVEDSISATLVPTASTPEPGTELMFGVGLIGLSLMGRRLRIS